MVNGPATGSPKDARFGCLTLRAMGLIVGQRRGEWRQPELRLICRLNPWMKKFVAGMRG
jgi:hypothetical protein